MSINIAAAAVLAVLATVCMAEAAAESRRMEEGGGVQREMSLDSRALIVDGTRRVLFAGEMHYTRSTPEMWPKLITKAKEGGLDVIQTYVFWNVHEPVQGQYNFEGRYDLVKFIKEIQAQGLYVSLRIGPFIEAEWKYGGFPFWLHDVPDITFRSDNEPFKVSTPAQPPANCYLIYGNDTKLRSTEDIAFAVALFIARKSGSYVSYYMYHGGTNFGRFASSYVTTSYYDGAPLDEYGLIWQPTWGHLRELHAAVKQSSEPLLFGTYSNFSLGQEQEVNAQHGSRTAEEVVSFSDINTWKAFKEPIPQDVSKAMYTGNQLFEHLSTTKDETDYLWYIVGRVFGIRKVSIQQGQGPENMLNNELWGYQVGLFGESNHIYTQEGSKSVEWITINNLAYSPLTWYKTTFPTPAGNDPVTLNLASMGKGEVWINGESIGRYWVSFKAPSGNPSQSLYHIPREFLNPQDNTLVLFEEMGGDPQQITVNTVSVTRVCSNVNELSTPSLQSQDKEPEVDLWCQEGKQISAIEFASYGNPVGDCTNFGYGNCHAGSSESVVKQACLGKNGCSIPVTPDTFGGDPCPGIQKALLVVASCR
nr:unnamed protein product [Digitaria exilis]